MTLIASSHVGLRVMSLQYISPITYYGLRIGFCHDLLSLHDGLKYNYAFCFVSM